LISRNKNQRIGKSRRWPRIMRLPAWPCHYVEDDADSDVVLSKYVLICGQSIISIAKIMAILIVINLPPYLLRHSLDRQHQQRLNLGYSLYV
jgi:hypothetical protein